MTHSTSLKTITLCLILFLFACEKKKLTPESPPPKEEPVVVQPETPTKPETPPKLDLKLLPGLWRLTSMPQNYYSIYFATDHFFNQENGSEWIIDLKGSWQVNGDNTVVLSGGVAFPTTFTIEKLTQDSLVGKVSGVTFRHVRMPIVESEYALSTLATNFETPSSVTEDKNGNILVLENIGERIRMISALDQKISIAIDRIDRLNDFTVDKNNDIIAVGELGKLKRISLASKEISDIYIDYSFSDGTIDKDLRYRPEAIRIDDEGNLYEGETFYPKVRKIEHGSGIIKDIIGTKMPTGGYQFNPNPGKGLNAYIIPIALALDQKGNLFVLDLMSNCIWKYTLATGNIQLIAGTGDAGFSPDGISATRSRFRNPRGIAVDAAGNIFISDTGNHRIRKISAIDNKVYTIAGNGLNGHNGDWANAALGKLTPSSLYVEADGDIVFVDDNSVRKLTLKK